MSNVSQRLLTLEIQRVRCLAAEGGTPCGFTADHILAELIAFLLRARALQKREVPWVTDAELEWLERRLPLYRRACDAAAKGRR